MRLEEIESSQLTALVNVSRPSGQLFFPMAVSAIHERYSFQGLPTAAEILEGEVLHFRHGHFDGNAFDLSIYNDGVIVKSASNTAFLEQVLEDVLGWAIAELGFVETTVQPKQVFFESSVVISMDLGVRSEILTKIAGRLANYQKQYGLRGSNFELAGVAIASDNTAYVGRKPTGFTIARRANVPFSSGIYYSSAPLKTDDHLDLLQAIENQFS